MIKTPQQLKKDGWLQFEGSDLHKADKDLWYKRIPTEKGQLFLFHSFKTKYITDVYYPTSSKKFEKELNSWMNFENKTPRKKDTLENFKKKHSDWLLELALNAYNEMKDPFTVNMTSKEGRKCYIRNMNQSDAGYVNGMEVLVDF